VLGIRWLAQHRYFVPPRSVVADAMTITKKWIQKWAATYPAEYDATIQRLAGQRPRYDDMVAIVRWKSARSLGYFRRNDARVVEQIVAEALGTEDDFQALTTLIALHGVKERVASAILSAYRPDRYTVMDARAWTSLRAHGYLKAAQRSSWLRRWEPYLNTCRTLALQHGLTLRALDKALYEAKGKAGLP
jgi:hypothetical protein